MSEKEKQIIEKLEKEEKSKFSFEPLYKAGNLSFEEEVRNFCLQMIFGWADFYKIRQVIILFFFIEELRQLGCCYAVYLIIVLLLKHLFHPFLIRIPIFSEQAINC